MFAALALAAALLFGPERHLPFTLTESLSDQPLVYPAATLSSNGYVVVYQTRVATFAQGLDSNATRIRDNAALLDLSNTTRVSAVASNGRTALAVFVTNDGVVTQLISPRGVPAGERHVIRRMGPYETENLTLVRISDRYLLLTADTVVGCRGQFLRDDGTADGDAFTISDDEDLTAASNGSTAFVVTRRTDLSEDAKTFLVLPGGGVMHTGAIRGASSGFEVLATWDGSAYVVAVPLALLTFDSNGALTRTQRLDLGDYHLRDLIGNGNGAALIAAKSSHGSYFDLATLDLSPGGGISGTLRIIHPGFTHYSTAMFDVDHYLFFIGGTPVLTDLGSRFDVGPPIALQTKAQYLPRIATAPSMSYLCWGEIDGLHVARFHDDAFIGTSALAIPGHNPGLSQMIAADDDRALVVGATDGGVEGRFVERDGSLSPIFVLPAPLRYPSNVVRVDGRWVVIASDHNSSLIKAVTVDDSGRVIDEVLLSDDPLTAAAGNSLLFLTHNSAGDYQLTFADEAGRASQSITVGNESQFARAALVASGDRALAIWQSYSPGTLHTATIDVRTRRVIRSNVYNDSLLFGYALRGAWTGESFLLLDSGAGFSTFSTDGEIIGKGAVPIPIYASNPDIAPSADGALITYTRSGADVGAGDVERIFVRTLQETASRTRAVHH